MKLSARNQITGKILSIKKGPVSTLVTLEIAPGLKLTSVITADAAKDLKLAKGKTAVAIIKSSSILLGVED
jgi:molybdopterin-binding protein